MDEKSALWTSAFSPLTIDRDRVFIEKLGHLDHCLNAATPDPNWALHGTGNYHAGTGNYHAGIRETTFP